jgi:hypothetical protein
MTATDEIDWKPCRHDDSSWCTEECLPPDKRGKGLLDRPAQAMTDTEALVDIGGERFNVPAILRQLDSEIADYAGFATFPKMLRRLIAAQHADRERLQALLDAERLNAISQFGQLLEQIERLAARLEASEAVAREMAKYAGHGDKCPIFSKCTCGLAALLALVE